MGTRPPPFMTSSSCNSSPLVSRAVLRKNMRAPEGGLSIVSPAIALMLLPFPRIDIMPPKVVQCMLRNSLRNPYSPECVEKLSHSLGPLQGVEDPGRAEDGTMGMGGVGIISLSPYERRPINQLRTIASTGPLI